MARIVIHHTLAQGQVDQDGLRFMRKVLKEARYVARLRLASGPYTTGHLAQSINIKGPFLEPGLRITGEVGSPLSYAAVVEKGADPHPIYPVRARMLRFYWRKVGKMVVLPDVSHPGMRGKKYLEEAIITVGRRYNFVVVIYDV